MTTKQNQDKLGQTLWGIANELRGSMNADEEMIIGDSKNRYHE